MGDVSRFKCNTTTVVGSYGLIAASLCVAPISLDQGWVVIAFEPIGKFVCGSQPEIRDGSLKKNPLFVSLKKPNGRRYDDIKRGPKGYVIRDNEVLKRHEIARKHYALPRGILSNFVHFSAFSFVLKSERMEVPYYTPILYLVRFVAEALGGHQKTRPKLCPRFSSDS